jgi:Right handed beta helix region
MRILISIFQEAERSMKRIMSVLSYTVLFLLCLGGFSAQAATIYVRSTGNDATSCAQARNASTPRKTITAGIACLSGGDTLIVAGGTYTEGLGGMPSGTSGAPTTIQAAPGEQVTLRPSSHVDCVLYIAAGKSYVTIDGISVDSNHQSTFGACTDDENVHHIIFRNLEIKNGTASGMITFGHHLEMRNLHIHHNGNDATYDHGIYQEASDSLIIGNQIHDNGGYGIQNYSSPSTGISPSRNVYTGNVFYNQPSGGMWLVQGTDHLFSNNTIYGSATQPSSGALVCCGTNSKIYNNIVFANAHGGIVVLQGKDTGAEIKNNITYQNPDGNLVGVTNATVSGNLVVNPLLVNPPTDMHLQAGSPAIDAGLPVPSLGLTSGVEIGAYQYGGAPTPVLPAPQRLRATVQ